VITFEERVEKLLSEARTRCDSAEVVGLLRRGKILFVANGGHPDLQNYDVAEVALRVVKDGTLGSAFGSLNTEPSAMVDSALLSAKYGSKADFEFTPGDVQDRPNPAKIYDKACADLTPEWLAAEGRRICDYILEREPGIQFNAQLDCEDRWVIYANSLDRRGQYKRTRLTTFVQHMFEGSKEGIEKMETSCKPFTMPDEKLDELIWERRAMRTPAKDVATGPSEVLVLPTATWALVMRLTHGVDGSSVARKLSPISEKKGEEIFNASVTVREAPDRDWEPGSLPFDDEGVPTQPRAIVEKGVLKDFIFSRRSAARAGVQSTGNGLKRIMWGDGIEHAPACYFSNLVMEPGDTSIHDIISNMQDGVVVCDVIGFHSGNILAGHHSMGVGTGFRVVDGKPQGRVIDTMISGNIYEDFKRIKALSRETEPTLVGRVPAILFDGMQVSTKS